MPVQSTEVRPTRCDPIQSVGVVIVTHNHQDYVASCLDSLPPSRSADLRVVIRDCGSADATVAIARAHALSPLVLTGSNVGFAAGCNDGARHLGHSVDAVLFLNPDTQLHFNIGELAARVSTLPDCGVVSVMQYALEGGPVWCWDNFPNANLEWRKAFNRPLLQRSATGYTTDRTVDWIVGSLLFVRRDRFWDIGGFDERFFLFYEEIDLCKRMVEAGQKNHFIHDLSYVHRSRGKDTLWREVLRLNSRRLFDSKWLTRREQFECQVAQSCRWLLTILRPRSTSDRRYAVARLLATWDLLRAHTSGPYVGHVRRARRSREGSDLRK